MYVPESSIAPDASQGPTSTGAKVHGWRLMATGAGASALTIDGQKPANEAPTATATAMERVLICPLPKSGDRRADLALIQTTCQRRFSTGGEVRAHAPLPNPLPCRERGLLVRGGASFHCGLGCRQACDGDSERAARYVVEPDAVAEMDRVGVAAMLAADPHFQLRPGFAPLAHGQLHQPAHALLVDRLEWIARKDLALEVADDEVALGVVA